MSELTFERLPEAVNRLTEEVGELKALLIHKNELEAIQPQDELLTIQQAAEFLRVTVPTMYGKVSQRTIPFMKRGKRLYFSRTELIEYVKGGRKKTTDEIEQEAKTYTKKKGGNNA